MSTLAEWRYTLKMFRKNMWALFGVCIVITVIIIAILAPVIAPYDPYATSVQSYQPPSREHPFGTDILGRDILSRVIWGSRNSLMIGIFSSLISTLIGVIIGSITGYYRGVTDTVAMRISEVILVIPKYFLYIMIISMLRVRTIGLVIGLIGGFEWVSTARIVRSEFLSLRELDYVKAARAIGARDIRIILLHLLPNAMSSIIIITTMNIGANILLASGLGFLGLLDPTMLEWGSILAYGRKLIRHAWWICAFPGLMIFLTVLGFNQLGDGLRDALDPRLRGRVYKA
ncbi:MAG: ABC transporter permease [Candidatus Bathyarchaeota archaeon]|nr:ABC transporter permease [Candidatus Bathyarchaeota archaeon]MDH5746145.1 ABC transporter permease [Candidatus Bathyarchaeota archaeon]